MVPWFGAEMGACARAARGKTVGWIGKGGYTLGDASDLVQPLWRQGFLEDASIRTLRTLQGGGSG